MILVCINLKIFDNFGRLIKSVLEYNRKIDLSYKNMYANWFPIFLNYDFWFLLFFCVKSATFLCLVHFLQFKIIIYLQLQKS